MTAPARPTPPATLVELWDSPFGAALFNLYTKHMPCGDEIFSLRKRRVLAMLAALQSPPPAEGSQP